MDLNQNRKSRIIFLHHSTGKRIWLGGTNRYINKLSGRNDTQIWFRKYNKKNGTSYSIDELVFPKAVPYGWKNYPFDYYNIWVKHAGNSAYQEEPTLEMLTQNYDIIVFKHCYPVSKILPDTGTPDIDSGEKRLENYKLQYLALRDKIHQFPDKIFVLWTPAVMTKKLLTEPEAQRTRDFHDWILNEWKIPGDNIFVWDFYNFETEGGYYLKDEYSSGDTDSHPGSQLAKRLSPLFCKFIVDTIEKR